MPGIAQWALEGAARLMANGGFSKSVVHDRLMANWRNSANSLEEFLTEDCVLSPEGHYKRADLYRDYIEWCRDNGRKAFSKSRVKELLLHNVGHALRLVESDGYETFAGVGKKAPKPVQKSSVAAGASVPIMTSLDDLSGIDPERVF